VIYGSHLTLIALVNLLLWIDMHRSVAAHVQIVRSSLALALFVLALLLGAIWPNFAPYLWFAVFATSLIGPDQQTTSVQTLGDITFDKPTATLRPGPTFGPRPPAGSGQERS
jgi:hypothetical protein